MLLLLHVFRNQHPRFLATVVSASSSLSQQCQEYHQKHNRGALANERAKDTAARRGKTRKDARDSAGTQTAKLLAWILRHGAHQEGLAMRTDGFVRVRDLLLNPKFRSLDFLALEKIVKEDAKKRFRLLLDPNDTSVWWICANQGHSINSIHPTMQPILSAAEVPVAVHGTTRQAWKSISRRGLSRMTRNHIHLAQGNAGSEVISGMRTSSEIYIYINVQKALSAGIKFYLSANGVVLTPGDRLGFLGTQFFKRVTTMSGDEEIAVPGCNKDDDELLPSDGSTNEADPPNR